jgi:putative membrane protein
MHRRILLQTLAVAAGGGASILAVRSGPAQAAAGSAMGEAETKHAQDTKRAGALSLATSRVAVSKAASGKVKQFAEWEVAEQETIADVLKSMEAGEGTAEGALHPPTDAETEAAVDDQGKKKLADLKAMSGAEFDKAYLAAQLEGHKELLTLQETYLKAGQNREHLSVTKLARGQIKEHITILELLPKMG